MTWRELWGLFIWAQFACVVGLVVSVVGLVVAVMTHELKGRR